MKAKFLTPILMVVLAVSLASCSLAGLGYRYADWLIKRRIMEVIKLYSPQQEKLEKILDDYMAWHKKEMLPRYQWTLEKAAARMKESDKNPVTHDEMKAFMETIRELYSDSYKPLSFKVIPVLQELGEAQVERSRTLITRKLDDLKEKASESKEERLTELQEAWRDNLKEYLGKVTPEQEKLILEHTPRLLTSSKAKFARGVSQMKTFISIYEELPIEEKSPEERAKVEEQRALKLKDFFNGWGEGPHYDQWRVEVALFVSKLIKSLDNEQRKNFTEVLEKWAAKVKEMRSN